MWCAYDTELQCPVAIKVARPDRFGPHGRAEAFLREARRVAQLAHPGIVSVYDVGQEGLCYYIISEFIEGTNLSDRIGRSRPSLDESVTIVRQVAIALHHVHLHHIIHRDIKPANILIDCNGQPHITDFGIAKSDADDAPATLEGQLVGTPVYMSPEQAKGQSRDTDCRTDLYSLGVVFFELLTGARPFLGDITILLKHIIEDDPPRPRKLNNRIPRDLETICLKCLEKEPALDMRPHTTWLKTWIGIVAASQ